jgi:hypothetical protein
MSENQRTVEAAVKAIMSRISVPMDLRGFGGKQAGLLLGSNVLSKIEVAARVAIAAELDAHGQPQRV